MTRRSCEQSEPRLVAKHIATHHHLLNPMENSKHPPITVDAKDGQNVSVVGDTYRILVTGKQTGGAFATIDMLIPPAGGPGPHAHAEFQESFYVIAGEIEVKSEAGTY